MTESRLPPDSQQSSIPPRIVAVPSSPPLDGVGAGEWDVWGPDTELPTPARGAAELIREGLLVLPNLVKLMARLMTDPRVPRRRKYLMGFAAVYVVSPIDLIPEAIFPVVGHVDDLLLLVFSINHLLNGVPPSVLREYWDGEPDGLEVVYGLLHWVSEFMPGPIRRSLIGS